MAGFAYNHAINASTGYTPYEFNCGYYLEVFFKKSSNPCFKSKSANKLLIELQELMTVCRKNIHHA